MLHLHLLCCTKLTEAGFDGVGGAIVVSANRLIGAGACDIIFDIFFSAPFFSHNVCNNFRLALSVSSMLRIFSLRKCKELLIDFFQINSTYSTPMSTSGIPLNI